MLGEEGRGKGEEGDVRCRIGQIGGDGVSERLRRVVRARGAESGVLRVGGSPSRRSAWRRPCRDRRRAFLCLSISVYRRVHRGPQAVSLGRLVALHRGDGARLARPSARGTTARPVRAAPGGRRPDCATRGELCGHALGQRLGLGTAGATALFPSLMERGRQAYGWQTTCLIMGGLRAAIMLPLGALLYRDAPERYGLAPDEAAPRRIVYGPEEVYRRRGWRRPDRS